MAEMRDEHASTLKDKDRAIRQLKSERDSLYEELKCPSTTKSHKSIGNPFQANLARPPSGNMISKVFSDIKTLKSVKTEKVKAPPVQ